VGDKQIKKKEGEKVVIVNAAEQRKGVKRVRYGNYTFIGHVYKL
jgi:hypothetical protein